MDYSSPTTWAECDEAKEELDFELKTFTVRDASLDLAFERADRSKASTSSELAKVDSKIASNTALLGVASIDAQTREEATDELAALQVRRTTLTKRKRLTTGVVRFLGEVDAEQIASQVATLTAIRDGIAPHRATLSA
ncbi:hypothetical protein [Hymenobacter terrenus]|uniref:hypothetical protein n=1 Tax=Hymenobacter terrenus TaxID=1629124 RepID=UPI00061955D8|nr:hypothetical protein [Hymenobacter terrenus]